MAGYFAAMLFGVALFCGGILFERVRNLPASEEENEGENTEINTGFLKQWENLLNYDGNRQEEEYED